MAAVQLEGIRKTVTLHLQDGVSIPVFDDVGLDVIRVAKARGAALVGIFHDRDVRDQVADRTIAIEPRKAAA